MTQKSDLPVALMGLLIGAVALLAVNFAIIQMVNMKHGTKAEAGHTAH